MNIVYSSSDSYCEIAGISMLSLLENNSSVRELNVYLIDNGISVENKKRLEDMFKSFGREIHYLQPLDIESFAKTKINIGRWNISTFYRLFLSTMLPELDKVLFIDCDTLVLEELSDLWNMDFKDKWVYGVDDCRGAAYRTNIGLEPEDNYINNGVLLMNLAAWRENNVEQRFLQFIHDNQGDITFVDQDDYIDNDYIETLVSNIKDNDILILNPSQKQKVIEECSSKSLLNIKFMTLNDLKENFYFKYDEKAHLYLMKKYDFAYDVANKYLNNLYYLYFASDINDPKIIHLKKLKKELHQMLIKIPLQLML